MWVYDGESWTREGGAEETRPAVPTGPEEMLPVPELQILEIVHTPRTREIHVPVAIPSVVRKPR
jgi:hypothetical protein